MTNILIIEGNTPEVIERNAVTGLGGQAENYGKALKKCADGLDIRWVEPYSPDFDAGTLRLNEADGVVFTGSSVNWSTSAPEAKPLRDVMEIVFATGLPTLGSCNGMQLAAVVLGGAVDASPNGKELGMARDIRLTDAGLNHPLHAGRFSGFACPCLHRDEVSRLPDGAVLTATNDHSAVQAMVYESNGVKFWGMQYHPEASPADFARIVRVPNGFFADGRNLAEDLQAAGDNPFGEAARTLGALKNDLEPDMRMRELSNWLADVQGKKVEAAA